MHRGLNINAVVCEGATVLEYLAFKDQALLVGWDTLFVLYLALDHLNRI